MTNSLDILKRTEFIKTLKTLVKFYSDNKKGVTFSIDGLWGVGKTFVLEKFINEVITHNNATENPDPYIIFSYNCWEYDYYDEPLMAIIASLSDNIKSFKTRTDPNHQKYTDGFDKLSKAVINIGNQLVKNKLGLDLEEVHNATKEQENKDVDSYYNFKQEIQNLKDKLKDLAKEATVIIIVDELDRCVPSYAIKTLERLHHISHNVENIIVILSIDQTQLDNSIKTIFGTDTDTERYLKKFVDFGLRLDAGNLDNIWFEKYETQYFAIAKTNPDAYKEMQEILKLSMNLISAREQEKTIKKATLINSILCKEYPNTFDECLCAFTTSYLIINDYCKEKIGMVYIYNFLNTGTEYSMSERSKTYTSVRELFTTMFTKGGFAMGESYKALQKNTYGFFIAMFLIIKMDYNKKMFHNAQFNGQTSIQENDLDKYKNFLLAFEKLVKIF